MYHLANNELLIIVYNYFLPRLGLKKINFGRYLNLQDLLKKLMKLNYLCNSKYIKNIVKIYIIYSYGRVVLYSLEPNDVKLNFQTHFLYT